MQLDVNQRVKILLLFVPLIAATLPVSVEEDSSGTQRDNVYHQVNVHNLQLAQEMNSGVHVRVHVNQHVRSLDLRFVLRCANPRPVSAKQDLSGMQLAIAHHHFNVEAGLSGNFRTGG